MPDDLYKAVSHANRVLDWMENLASDEMPPQWMWPYEEELTFWFDEVERKRKEKYESPGEENSSPMMQNELAKERRK